MFVSDRTDTEKVVDGKEEIDMANILKHVKLDMKSTLSNTVQGCQYRFIIQIYDTAVISFCTIRKMKISKICTPFFVWLNCCEVLL